MKTIYLLFLLTIPFTSKAQWENELNQQLPIFDSIFAESKIIGLGESTHGTSEFTTARLEIFKYLVEKFDFNTFFLEADYSACLQANRYIRGEYEYADSAIFEFKLWPWVTVEMKSVLEWMKEYNQKNENQLSFVGSDMQLIIDDYAELKRRFKNEPKKWIQLDSIFRPLTTRENRKNIEIIIDKKDKWTDFKDNYSESSKEWNQISKTIDQWFIQHLDSNHLTYRDYSMGRNIADYISKHPKSKGIYFAHNTHCSNDRYYAGARLKEFLGKQYNSIALYTNSGNFRAITGVKKYRYENFDIPKAKKKSIESLVKKNEVFRCWTINKIPLNTNKHISIGAVYGKVPYKKSHFKVYPYRNWKSHLFDGVIVISNTKSTTNLY